jgi:DNA-binding NarL/FixJ family response regulator
MSRKTKMTEAAITQSSIAIGTTSVAIVEDDSGFRESLEVFLRRAEGVRFAGAFPSAEAALAQLPGNLPDVVLMDINLPKMSGIEAARLLKQSHPDARILMLTVYEDNNALFNSLKAGACGYLLKRTPPDKILEGIREAREGGMPLTPRMATKVSQFFQQAAASIDADNELDSLTEREWQTLELLSQGYLYKQVAQKMGVTYLTVHGYVKRIYEKLHVHSRTEAVIKFLKR